MFQKVYLPRYQQAANSSQSRPKIIKEESKNKNSSESITKNIPRKFPQERQVAAERKTNNNRQDVAVEKTNRQDAAGVNASKKVVAGFKEIAPGTYQFLQSGEKKHEQAPGLILPPEATGCWEACEQRFRRVDRLAGPYQHYNTPVYQFT
ncbi:MAG: hypothetical protein HQP61_00890 [Peptococcaceae bacterium]|nr:hypothetical protein [Candidatus Syntrophopropionicum ammoniitolerans]